MRMLTVYLEIGHRRAFASAIDWPGWSRGGRDEAGARAALLAHRPRYAAALAAAGVSFDVDDQQPAVVVERLVGDAGTDFGALSVPPAWDAAGLDEDELHRQVAILGAAWAALDAAARRHAGDELRKGPRGGGRDLSGIVAHVRDADAAYLRQLGARPALAGGEIVGMAALRQAAVAAVRARALGLPHDAPSRAQRPWSARWYVRRAAWHALDHAWEIEERAVPLDEPTST